MIVFMGTPECAIPTLAALLEAGEEVQVISQPDRPRGRGRRLQPTPVKQMARERGLPVWQPDSVNTPQALARLRERAPEFIVVVAFGQLLKPGVLATPRRGCVNAHFSLLPRHRGAAPVHWALMRGEAETGITTMLLDEGMDSGPVLLWEREPIRPDDNAGTLEARLAARAAPLMLRTLEGLRTGRLTPQPQDHDQATYAPRLKKEDLRLDWTRPASELAHRVRGLSPQPGAFTTHRGERLKVLTAHALARATKGGIPGEVIEIRPREGFIVDSGEGSVLVLGVQPPGGRPMPAADYLRAGGRLQVGDRLGDDDAGS